jgi:hypothetical protein
MRETVNMTGNTLTTVLDTSFFIAVAPFAFAANKLLNNSDADYIIRTCRAQDKAA